MGKEGERVWVVGGKGAFGFGWMSLRLCEERDEREGIWPERQMTGIAS